MKSVIAAMLTIVLLVTSGCDVPRRYPQPEEMLSRVDLRSPTAGQCDCGFVPGVSAAYVVNQTDRRVQASVNIWSEFLSGTYIDDHDEIVLLPPKGQKFLSCSITLDEGVGRAQASMATCNVRNKFKRTNDVYADRAFVKTELTALTDDASVGSGFCQRECKAGTPNCQELGPRYAQLTAPIKALVENAENETGTVTKEQMLGAYGLSDDDNKCERQGISVDARYVINEGPKECSIGSVSAAAIFARKMPIADRLSLLTSSTDITLFMPRKIKMTKSPVDLFATESATVGTFEDMNEAFYIKFREPLMSFAAKAELEDQNNRFSGWLRDISTIKYGDGNQKAVVLSTARGCLMFDVD